MVNPDVIIVKSSHRANVKSSEAQKAYRQRFKLADLEVSAYYQMIAQQEGKSLRGAAISDYLKGNDLFLKK